MEEQLKRFMVKQKKLILEADKEEEIAKLVGFAVGFLNGMRMFR